MTFQYSIAWALLVNRPLRFKTKNSSQPSLLHDEIIRTSLPYFKYNGECVAECIPSTIIIMLVVYSLIA